MIQVGILLGQIQFSDSVPKGTILRLDPFYIVIKVISVTLLVPGVSVL